MGTRNARDGLWDIPIPQNQQKQIDNNQTTHAILRPNNQHSVSVIIRKKQTHAELANYLHAACFSPVPSTFIKAISNNHLTSWPGLTATLINKHLQQSMATAQGHLNQERQHLQSTRTTQVPIQQKNEEDDDYPDANDPNNKTHDAAYTIVEFTPKETAYTNLTGRFPHRSGRGNEYILVGYHYDSNAILAEPVKNRTAEVLTKGWKALNAQFSKAGVQPTTYIMDNEISKELKNAMAKEEVKYQLVPPHCHRTNLAERAIQTFKQHFKAGLASTDPNFPLSEWDRLLPQAIITLNLLRTARVNPKLSAYAYLFGEFDFNKTPLAPPGTKVLAHSKPGNRASWAPHGLQGWYIGPSMEHYRCVKCYFPRTKSVRDVDTVTFFPKHVKFPSVGTEEYLKQAATDIITILNGQPNTTVPTLEGGEKTGNALLKIAQALKRCTEIKDLQVLQDSSEALSEVPTTTTTTARTVEITSNSNPNPNGATPSRVEPENTIRATTMEAVNQGEKEQDRLRYIQQEYVPSPRVQNSEKSYNPKSATPFLQQRYRLRPRANGTNFRDRATKFLMAQHIFNKQSAMHIYNSNGKRETIDTLLFGDRKETWTKSLSNELGRLAQGNIHGVKATDTIEFIHQREVPIHKAVTYANLVCAYRPLKSEPYRIRLVVGGDKLTYDEDPGSPAASLLETKLLVNSIISDAHEGARFMSCDLKDFFLATPMKSAEYMKIKWKYLPQDIRDKYNLQEKLAADGYVYVKIKKGMYGLKQAAILAYDLLVKNLTKSGYSPIPNTIGMWKHATRKTKFCLCVDDFGVKYHSKDDIEHLLGALRKDYTCTVDWEGKNFCGLEFDWNYAKEYVDIARPHYVKDTLRRFQHDTNKSPQHSPHEHTAIKYGTKGQRQYATSPDTSPLLDKKDTKFVQSVTGSFLYYARAIDSTMLPALNDIASQQAKPTEKTKEKCKRLLDYAATYPNTYVRFHASDMVLHVDTDAAYLVMPQARSRIAGYFYMGNEQGKTPHPELNGAVLIECKTLRHVVASAAEAEVGGIFHNAQMSIPIRVMLEGLGHPQPPTPIKTDNSTAHGFIYDNINLKKSKSWDMRYYWLRDRETQQQFNIYWQRGLDNHADYFTKHHATNHHKQTRPKYVRDHLACLTNRIENVFNNSAEKSTLGARVC